jgi:hypothetical protein
MINPMQLKTLRPFPTHPELDRQVLLFSAKEQAILASAARILVAARDLVGPETDEGMDLGKAETIIWEWLQ